MIDGVNAIKITYCFYFQQNVILLMNSLLLESRKR